VAKNEFSDLARKSLTTPAVRSPRKPTSNTVVHVDPRIPAGMFFTLTGTILGAFGLSTRGSTDVYAKSQGFDANLWWGLALLVFGIVMLALGRRGQMKMEKAGTREQGI
jgi:hypothetical protein